ncbi:type 4a pilus biogenesis protein PilO [Paenibacillus wulumuqiensis]|uniref:type 4a pilus biogenesis protein PilO n=1 Tax=Paenibacillus wulumuqiensis TaxID=1567107 RepID=UPI00061975DB|nr:type 4a pilus biogenesis protein PilO [Paenibacillus wulumuqiensis]
MEQLNKYRSSIMLGLALLFIILLAVYMLAVRPLGEQTETYEQNITELQQEGQLLQTRIAELQSHQGDNAAVMAAVPAEAASEQLLTALEQVGEKSRARLTNIEFQSIVPGANSSGEGVPIGTQAGQIQMNAEIQGGYAQIHEWMNQLQQMPRLVTIDSFSFEQPYQPILTAKVTFTAYYTIQ